MGAAAARRGAHLQPRAIVSPCPGATQSCRMIFAPEIEISNYDGTQIDGISACFEAT